MRAPAGDSILCRESPRAGGSYLYHTAGRTYLDGSGGPRSEIAIYPKGEESMTKTIVISMCLAASSLALAARAQDVRHYSEGPVTEVDYIQVEYGHFEEYIDWLNSTWKPTMEAFKKAGLIIDYKVLKLTPKAPDQPNISLCITFKNGAAALDKGVELEEVAKKVIGSTEVQNKARVGRNEYRKVLGTEYVREIILK